MASLTGQQIKDTYQSLLKTDDNGLITNAFKGITDGSGSTSGLYLKNDGVLFSGSVIISGSLLYSGSTINATVTSASYALTASYALNGESTNTGSFLITASAATNVITFTKGDNTTFNITVDTDLSGYTTVSSFNDFTSSYNTGSFSGSLEGIATTASYYVETDPIFTAVSGTFATTGSNIFVGNQTITGSLNITASGLTVFSSTGDVLEVSGSFLLYGSGSVTGNLNVSGSATVSNVLTLPYQDPLPSSPATGSIALSGSGATFVGMFVWTGAWTQI